MFPSYLWFLAPHRFFREELCVHSGWNREEKKRTNERGVSHKTSTYWTYKMLQKKMNQTTMASYSCHTIQYHIYRCHTLSRSVAVHSHSLAHCQRYGPSFPIGLLTLLNTLAWMLCIHKETTFSNGNERVNEWDGASERVNEQQQHANIRVKVMLCNQRLNWMTKVYMMAS